MLFRPMIVAAAVAFAAPASAEWIYLKGEDDPFKPARVQVAATISGGHALAFRCSDADDLVLIWTPHERADGALGALFERAPMKFLVIIDSAARVALEAEGGLTPEADKYMFTATKPAEVLPILHAAVAAKQRIAVAMEMLGNVLISNRFSLDKSKRPLQRLIEGCKLSPPTR